MLSAGGPVVKSLPAVEEPVKTWVQSLGSENALEEEMATHSRTLAGIFPRTEEPGSYSPCSHKESDTTE